jgi:hypothetical protein
MLLLLAVEGFPGISLCALLGILVSIFKDYLNAI